MHKEHKKGQGGEVPFVTAFIIPTGIHASVGGYLGDATPFANRIAALSDVTIVNPNVVNGGVLNLMADNVLYTEGTVMDLFFRGETLLKPSNKLNKIGVVVEKTDDKGRAYVQLPRLKPFDLYFIYNPDGYYRY